MRSLPSPLHGSGGRRTTQQHRLQDAGWTSLPPPPILLPQVDPIWPKCPIWRVTNLGVGVHFGEGCGNPPFFAFGQCPGDEYSKSISPHPISVSKDFEISVNGINQKQRQKKLNGFCTVNLQYNAPCYFRPQSVMRLANGPHSANSAKDHH